MRITPATMAFNAERNLNAAASRLAAIQDKIGSTKEINRSSDDPAGAAEVMSLHSQQRQNEQFTRNASNAAGWLSTADVALGTATDLLHRVRDLTMRGSNSGALSPEARQAIALELDQLSESMAAAANTQFNGRFVFAGTHDGAAAVDANHQFPAGTAVERRIGPVATVRVDTSGAAAFGEGPDSVFALVAGIAADLRNGLSVSGRLEAVDARMQDLLAAQATVGATHSTVLAAEESLLGDAVSLEGRRAGLEDIDLASAILELKTQEVSYQAALSATARTLQPSLMDFLR